MTSSRFPARWKFRRRSRSRSMPLRRTASPMTRAIALGCVIRGDTIHFEIVSQESSRALMDLAVARKLPLGNGILTVNNEAQAWARARASELEQGRRCRARRACDAAHQAPPGAGLIMADDTRSRRGARRRKRTGAVRHGSPPCRRCTRWTSAAPASTTSLRSSRATGSATRSRATHICRRKRRSSATSSPASCATRRSSIR